MMIVLILSCFFVPYEIAFPDQNAGTKIMRVNSVFLDPFHKKVSKHGLKYFVDKIMDILFLSDAIITFYAAVILDNHDIIDDRKKIAKHYLKGWFTLDILSCLPYGDLGELLLTKA